MLTTLSDHLLLRHDVFLLPAEHSLCSPESMRNSSSSDALQGDCLKALKTDDLPYRHPQHQPNDCNSCERLSSTPSDNLASLPSHRISPIENDAFQQVQDIMPNEYVKQRNDERGSSMETTRRTLEGAPFEIPEGEQPAEMIESLDKINDKTDQPYAINAKQSEVAVAENSANAPRVETQGNTASSSFSVSTTTDPSGESASVDNETTNAVYATPSSPVMLPLDSNNQFTSAANQASHSSNAASSAYTETSAPLQYDYAYRNPDGFGAGENVTSSCASAPSFAGSAIRNEGVPPGSNVNLNECSAASSISAPCNVASNEGFRPSGAQDPSCHLQSSGGAPVSEASIVLTQANSEGCFRGELQLSNEEYELLLRTFQFGNSTSGWRFDPVVEPPGKKNKKKGKQPGGRRGADVHSGGSTVHGTLGRFGRHSKSEQFDEQSHTTQTSFDQSVVSQAQSAIPTEPTEYGRKPSRKKNAAGGAVPAGSSHAATNSPSLSTNVSPMSLNAAVSFPPFCRPPPPPAVLDRMPDWMRRLHRAIFELCSAPNCLPFVSDFLLSEPGYEECLSSILPCGPVCLQSVLDNLENCTYSQSTQVISEVYGIFTCAFRHYEPGSNSWMRAHQSSVIFQKILRNHCIDENVVMEVENTPPATGKVDDLLKRMVSNGREKKRRGGSTSAVGKTKVPRANAKSETGRSPKSSTKRSSAGSKTTSKYMKNKAVTDAERAEFQNLLINLSQSHHFELFNTFQHKAVWRTLEGGEVELDDQGTSPSMFREMVNWCKAHLAASASQQSQYPSNGIYGGQEPMHHLHHSHANEQELYPAPKRRKQAEIGADYSSNSSSDASEGEM